MKWFLLWALGGTGVLVVALCLTVLFLRGRIRRHHRVDRKVETGAPLRWMVDPRSPARLHRRLAKIGTTVEAVITDHQARRRLASLGRRAEPSPLAATATDLKAQAVAMDRHLAKVVSLSSGSRRGALDEISRQVAQLEVAATRLAALSARSLTPSTLQHHLDDDAAGQVERLAEAQRELDALDAGAGLRPARSAAPAGPLAEPRWSPAPGVAPSAVDGGSPSQG